MKKLLLLGIALSFYLSTPASAQFEKGEQYWGGTIRFNGGSAQTKVTGNVTNSTKEVEHEISPEIQWGYFAKKSTMFGLGLRYNLELISSTTNDVKESGNIQSLYFLPFMRNYKSLSENWAIFLHTELSPGFSKLKEEGLSSSTHWNYGASLRPGIVYSLPERKLAIEAYANVLSLETSYAPHKVGGGGRFILGTGITSAIPTYFTLRIAKHITTKK